MAISNENEPIICDQGVSWKKMYSRVDSLNNYLELPPFIHSFIQQMVSIFYYMLGSILLYTPAGTTGQSESKWTKKTTINKNLQPLGTYILNG